VSFQGRVRGRWFLDWIVSHSPRAPGRRNWLPFAAGLCLLGERDDIMAPPLLIAGLIITGLVLITVDFYLPGFILGSIGAVLMLIALALIYSHYGWEWAVVAFLGEIIIGTVAGYLSIRYFPHTAAGRRMILNETQTDRRAQPLKPADWISREGVAETVLRPSGMALFDDERLDVVAESSMIKQGSAIRVVAVQENRLVVRPI